MADWDFGAGWMHKTINETRLHVCVMAMDRWYNRIMSEVKRASVYPKSTDTHIHTQSKSIYSLNLFTLPRITNPCKSILHLQFQRAIGSVVFSILLCSFLIAIHRFVHSSVCMMFLFCFIKFEGVVFGFVASVVHDRRSLAGVLQTACSVFGCRCCCCRPFFFSVRLKNEWRLCHPCTVIVMLCYPQRINTTWIETSLTSLFTRLDVIYSYAKNMFFLLSCFGGYFLRLRHHHHHLTFFAVASALCLL